MYFTIEGDWQTDFELMRSSGDFVYVNMDSQMEPAIVKSLSESDYPVSPLKWGLDRMSKRKVTKYNGEFSSSNYGENVDIYIMDGGVNYGHPEFSNLASDGGPRARSINHNSVPTDPWYIDLAGTDNAQDTVGGASHGTGVAMCAAGKEIGVAHNATIISVRVDLSYSQVTLAMDSIIQHHKLKPIRRHSVLNLSFGSSFKPAPGNFQGTQALMVYDASLAGAVMDDLVQAAISAGITTTVAAGNGPERLSQRGYHPAMSWAGVNAAGAIPGYGGSVVQTRVFRGPNEPDSSLLAIGDAMWADFGETGDKAGYVLSSTGWAPHTIGYSNGTINMLVNYWEGLSYEFDQASHDVLVKSGIYNNGPYSIAANTYVDVYFTFMDPFLYDIPGIRSQAVDGSVWVKVNPYTGPVCTIWRRVSGVWVDSGNTTHIGPSMGGLNVESTGLGSTISNTSEVIFVGSCAANDYVSAFSNYGGRVDLYAPGQGLTFPDPYATSIVDMSASAGGSGTSYSAPFVAGLAAIYLNDRTQPGVNGVVSAGSGPSSVRAHLIDNASTGLKNKAIFKDYDLMYLNNTRADFGIGGNIFHPTYGEDFIKVYTSGASTGRFVSAAVYGAITAENPLDFNNALKDYIPSGGSHKIAKLLTALPPLYDFTDYYSDGVVGYHPLYGYRYLLGKWDFTKAAIEEFDYAALDATVHDRIAFNSFVDKSVIPFQSEVTALTFANANNNKVFLQAGTHSWDGEQIGKQVYALTSGSLPTGVTLNPDGTFTSNIAAGATSTPVAFSVSVTDSLGSTLTANYTGALSPYDYGMRVFDGAGNVTFDADTRGHNLIAVYDVVGDGVFTESIDISGLPELSNASISTTAQLIGHSSYDAWNDIEFPICPIIEKRHYIEHVTETIQSRIDVTYTLQALDSCFTSNAGTPWSTYKNGLTVRVYVWAINHVHIDYIVESTGTIK